MGDNIEQVDYSGYLTSVYPDTTWTLSTLSGGLVNTTMRAVRTSSTGRAGNAPPSLVLKHARPFVQSEGPEFSFTTQRQAVEAAMLELVQADDGPVKYMTKEERQKHFPRLLRHDHGTESSLHLTDQPLDSSILLITDLGPLEDCVEFLQDNAATLSTDTVASIGNTVGKILAGFHTTNLTHSPQALTNDITHDLVFLAAVEPVRQHLAHLPNGEQLYKRIENDFTRPKYKYPEVLSHGDIHSGSVLISKEMNDIYPIVIDMEFSKLGGRGVNGDMAQFLSSIHCGLIAAETSDDFAATASIYTFIKSLCSSYQTASGMNFRRHADNGVAQLLRSAFILHGREVINYAHDTCKNDHHADKMVSVGVWYLERAGDDMESFLEESNWVRMGEEHGMVIQSLFKEAHN